MTDQELLQKAIEKAEKKGYKNPFVWAHPNDVIFSHDFAKAFWGEKPYVMRSDKNTKFYSTSNLTIKADGTWEVDIVSWQYHLQQMVLEENPIKYLVKFLKGGEKE